MMNHAIKNPYKFEGLCYSVRGLVLTILGTILIFSVKEKVIAENQTTATLIFVGGIILLIIGMASLIKGLLRMLRFYVGKDIPQNLVNGYDNTSKRYQELLEMLKVGANPTFDDPEENSTQHILESIIPRLTETPPYIRKIALLIFEQMLRSSALYLLFGIAIFSGISGLTSITDTPVANWLGWSLVIQQFIVWSKTFIISGNMNISISYHNIYKMLIIPVIAAILIPAILLQVQHQYPLPDLPLSSFPLLIIEGILVLIICASIFFLIITRIPKQETEEHISKQSVNWQANIHPSDLFDHLERVMEHYGYLRYLECKPELKAEGSANKGSFNGNVFYETLPVPIQNDYSDRIKPVLISVTVIGHLLFACAGIWLFYSLISLKQINIEFFINTYFLPLITWSFSSILISAVYIFWSEFHYESDILYFVTRGTYSEYKRSVGTSSDDSFTDVGIYVRSNITAHIYVTKIKSSTCTLKGVRYIVDMHQNNQLIENTKISFEEFISGRKMIDNYSAEDLETVSNISQMSQIVRDMKKRNELPTLPDNKIIASDSDSEEWESEAE